MARARARANERPPVRGVDLDRQARCAHYHSVLDIVAIKMRCCDAWYACKDCHEALAGHPIEAWPRDEWAQIAVLCGACGDQMSIEAYLACDNACPVCAAPFNPGCRHHHHYYFKALALSGRSGAAPPASTTG
ncbi:MAG: CHY zinc finger protein [Caulobacteraceae bacterium]